MWNLVHPPLYLQLHIHEKPRGIQVWRQFLSIPCDQFSVLSRARWNLHARHGLHSCRSPFIPYPLICRTKIILDMLRWDTPTFNQFVTAMLFINSHIFSNNYINKHVIFPYGKLSHYCSKAVLPFIHTFFLSPLLMNCNYSFSLWHFDPCSKDENHNCGTLRQLVSIKNGKKKAGKWSHCIPL